MPRPPTTVGGANSISSGKMSEWSKVTVLKAVYRGFKSLSFLRPRFSPTPEVWGDRAGGFFQLRD
jgi:hypothetical protein